MLFEKCFPKEGILFTAVFNTAFNKKNFFFGESK